MKFTVVNQQNEVVAEVAVDPECALAQNEDCEFSHVLGEFTEGPAFSGLKPLLERMNRDFWAARHTEAYATSARLDALNLIGLGPDGRRYKVFNVCFQRGGLLFAVSLDET